jgi:hypothetical protein
MADNKENYWSKHLWSIIQCGLAFYCAAFATWNFFYSRPIPIASPSQNSAPIPLGGAIVIPAGYVMPFWLWIGIIALVLSVAIPAILRLIRGWKKTPSLQLSGIVPGIPSLSALLGQNPSVEFDARKFFALAYYSPITAEIEKNIKIVAQQNSPNDKEAFYARFIGLGAVAYQHDVTWFSIYGSQLKALTELNPRGPIPVADLKKHYDKACTDYPNTYANYSFEQWLEFMKLRMLIVRYPSQMVEISFNGKDFLKYIAHVGMNINGKHN